MSEDQVPNERARIGDEEMATDRLSAPAAYPKFLIVEAPIWIHLAREPGTKCVAGDIMSQPPPAKIQRSYSTANSSHPPFEITVLTNGRNLLLKSQQEAEYAKILRSHLHSRLADKLPTFEIRNHLDRPTKIGTRPDQGPYEELEVNMQRAMSTGRSKLQSVFARSVTA